MLIDTIELANLGKCISEIVNKLGFHIKWEFDEKNDSVNVRIIDNHDAQISSRIMISRKEMDVSSIINRNKVKKKIDWACKQLIEQRDSFLF